MKNGHFYYINDQYFLDFPDDKLMQNKETVNGVAHDRPCFYAFQDNSTGLFWLIPFSSQTNKFKAIYEKKKVLTRIIQYYYPEMHRNKGDHEQRH